MKLRLVLAVALVVFLAANLRSAVTSFSPVVFFIREDLGITSITESLIAATAPVMFAIGALLGTRPARRLGLEMTSLIVGGMIFAGHLMRGLAISGEWLIVGSLVALAGMGVGNLILPSIIRRYFPNHIGLLTTVYITFISFGTFVPPLIAVSVAESFGWRVSLAQWAVLAALILIPAAALLKENKKVELSVKPAKLPLFQSPTAVAVMTIFLVSAITAYLSFGWLPTIAVEHAGVDVGQAALLLSIFAFMGLPAGLIAPLLAEKFPNTQWLIVAGAGSSGVIGSLGFIFVPELIFVFIVFLGLAQLTFPLSLALFNLRSRYPDTVLQISSFAQFLGYSAASVTTLSVGFIRDLTGGWEIVLAVIGASNLLVITAAITLSKKRFIEDELAPTVE
ncbi:MAG: MFS transporter [Microbacteriaceae bacterium]|nr:MFS transporter [Microbacteriaceae bacterium]